MRIVLFDKRTGSTIDDDYIQNIYIGLDGKPYEIQAACCDGVCWMDTEDVSDKYGVYLLGVDLEL